MQLAAPAVVETAPIRCPADEAARREFATPLRPRPPVRPCAGDVPGLCKGDLQSHIDALERDVTRKNATGQRVIKSQDECMGRAAAGTAKAGV